MTRCAASFHTADGTSEHLVIQIYSLLHKLPQKGLKCLSNLKWKVCYYAVG